MLTLTLGVNGLLVFKLHLRMNYIVLQPDLHRYGILRSPDGRFEPGSDGERKR